MIGNTYANGNLVVIDYDPQKRFAKVRCRCGNVEGISRYMLVSGRADRCKRCRDHRGYLKSLTVDLQLLEGVEKATAARILRSYAEHLKSCMANSVRASSFAIYVREARKVAELYTEEAPESFEERLAHSTIQSYSQYQSPRVEWR